MKTKQRTYKFRVYPTVGQRQRSEKLLSSHCEIYNAALEERKNAWKHSKTSVSFYDQWAQMKYIRADRPDIAMWSASAQQRTVKRVDTAFQAFFKRIKKGEKAGYPRFKSSSRWDTVDCTNGNGAKWIDPEGSSKYGRAYFKGVGYIKVSTSRKVVGEVKQISLKRENGGRRWYVLLAAKTELGSEDLEPTGKEVGVDVGIARFLTTSDGDIVANPRFGKSVEDDMVILQQKLSRCKRGSGNRNRVKRKISKLHRKVRNQRLDFHHKTARNLVNNYDLIAVEKLNIKGMSKRAKPKPGEDNPGEYLPNGGARKTGLNKAINDVAWGNFFNILTAKAESAGRLVVKVDPRNTSITCHKCGEKATRPEQAVVVCQACGPFDADLNGAINILNRAKRGSMVQGTEPKSLSNIES